MEKTVDIKINSHYFWRIFFAVVIVLGHTGGDYGWIRTDNTSTYIGVDYFYIMSGLFLARSVCMRNESATEYSLRRVIKLWPHAIFSFLILFLWKQRESIALAVDDSCQSGTTFL